MLAWIDERHPRVTGIIEQFFSYATVISLRVVVPSLARGQRGGMWWNT